jgi:hypothetical protein
MVNARVAAIGLAFLCTALAGQQSQQIHFTIKITNSAGYVLSGAGIRVESSSMGIERSVSTDSQGEAAFDLPQGKHLLTISGPGIKTWKEEIDAQPGSDQTISASVDQDNLPRCGPCMGEPGPGIPTEPYILNALILIEPLQTLPLIARRVHKRHFL